MGGSIAEGTADVKDGDMLFTNRQLAKLQAKYELTGREVEVVRLLAEGVESNAEIAERLGIELGTAKVHMANIYRKAGRSTKLSLILAFAKDVR